MLFIRVILAAFSRTAAERRAPSERTAILIPSNSGYDPVKAIFEAQCG
jgi:hypothetical protein